MSSGPLVFKFKRGDRFNLSLMRKVDGVSSPLPEGLSVASQVRTPQGDLVCDLDVSLNNQGGLILLSKDMQSTESWPKDCQIDVELTLGDDRDSSETILIDVVRDVTHA